MKRVAVKGLGVLVLAFSMQAPVWARDVIGDDEEETPKKEEPRKKAPEKAPEKAKDAPPAKDAKAAPPAKDAKDAPPAKDAKDAPPAKDAKAAPPAKDAEAPKDEKAGKRKKTEEELEAEKEAAEDAAIKKAEEAARQKREEAERKKKEQDDKRNEKKAAQGKANLEDSRRSRTYKREKSGLLFTTKVIPGAPEDNKLTDVEFVITEKLEDPDPTYGDYAPVEDGEFVATLTCQSLPAPKDPKAKPEALPPPVSYQVHNLGDAGKYGFHMTLPKPGVWQVKVVGKKKDAKQAAEVTFPLHVSIWPPPDFDAEELNNTKLGGGSRRALE